MGWVATHEMPLEPRWSPNLNLAAVPADSKGYDIRELNIAAAQGHADRLLRQCFTTVKEHQRTFYWVFNADMSTEFARRLELASAVGTAVSFQRRELRSDLAALPVPVYRRFLYPADCRHIGLPGSCSLYSWFLFVAASSGRRTSPLQPGCSRILLHTLTNNISNA